jgi:APA family basic amino acid/polyamine antiporter
MKPSLRREIGLFEAVAFGVGTILGAGIYALIGPASGLAGNAVWISFVIGAVISSFTGLSYAELSTMFPKAAAEYVFAREAFNSRFWAFLLGWLIVFAGVVSVSTVAIGFASYLKSYLNLPVPILAIILIGFLSLVNYAGIEESSRVNIVFLIVEVFGLLFVTILGFSLFPSVNYLETTSGTGGVLAASALIFFAYLGFEDIVNIAEEMENPEKTIPKALILSIVVATVFYVLVAVATVSLADWRQLSTSSAPLAYAVSRVLGANAFLMLSVIALFATANTVLILLVVGSRMVYGMSRDGALPAAFSNIDERTGVPRIAIFTTMVLSMVFASLGDLRLIAGVTNFATFLIFAFVNFSLIWLRHKQPGLRRPFRVPLNIGWFPLIPFLGLISCMFLLLHISSSAMIIGFVALGLGAIVYRTLGARQL